VPLGWEFWLDLRNRKSCPLGWICDYYLPEWMFVMRNLGLILLFALAVCEAVCEGKRMLARYQSHKQRK